MNLDKFGRRSMHKITSLPGPRGERGLTGPQGAEGSRGPPGNGFKLTILNDFDLQFKCIKNLGKPEENHDAVTKMYVDNEITKMYNEFTSLLNQSKTNINNGISKKT